MFNRNPPSYLFGHPVIYLDTVASTNDYAKDLLVREPKKDSFIVVAGDQTKGKGRRGNEWYFEKGKDLAMTFVVNGLKFPSSKAFLLNMISSLAISRTLDSILGGPFSTIKWPNDILINSNKISGILIENMLKDRKIETSIIGIGINVNQQYGLPRTTSILKILKEDFDALKVLELLVSQLEGFLSNWKKEELEIKESYNQSLFGKGSHVSFQKDEELKEGIFLGLDANGKIMVEIMGKAQKFSQEAIEKLRFE